jgi:hypothetical protein
MYALQNQGSSHSSTAVGYASLYAANGANNVGIGGDSLKELSSGGSNTALGYRAGRYYGSGTSGLATANKCIYVGELSRGNADSMTNEIVIGYNALGAGGSNTVTIGSNNITDVYMAQDAGATVHCAVVQEGSSIKIKENITPIESPLDKITKLRGIEFDYKENKEHSIGMIAEEVDEVFPELVSRDSTGDVTAMSYSRMVPVLLEAIKELSREVEELKMNNRDIYNNKAGDN